jgi:transcriptional regulator with AAA-type ATPase domain
MLEERVPQSPPDTVEDSVRNRRDAGIVAKPYLFVVLEGDRPLVGGARFSLEGVSEIYVCRGDDRSAVIADAAGVRRLTLSLPAPSLSRLHARFTRAPVGWYLEDAGARNGCYLNGERVERALVGETDLVELGHVFLTLRTMPQPRGADVGTLETGDLAGMPAGLRTLLPPLAARLEDLRRVARSTIGVLLVGETGTGKEVLARAIHETSGRGGPFIPVNCNTLTENLAESQLFGHVKGAFSGAIADAPGFVRAADKGTLLLDEVADLGATAQGALLRVLQEREVVPVGRAHAHKVDVRFIGTSPRPLAIGDSFRSDLFARLSGFVYEMTPLRDRREDFGLLIAGLLRRAGIGEGDRPQIAPDLGLGLLTHRWPLNVRELEQLLHRTWLLADGGLMSGSPRFVVAGSSEAARGWEAPARPRALSPEEQEAQQQVADALAAARGNVTEAARALGKGRVQFHRLMKRLGVDARRFRG